MATSQNTQTNRTDDGGKSKDITPPRQNEATGTPGGAVTPTSGSTAGTQGGAATATARSFYDQAKDTASKAYEAVTDKTAAKLDEQRTSLSGGLATVADSVRQVSDNLGSSQTDSGLAEAAAKYTNTAAQKIESVAGYFENKGVREMARDLEGFARRNPALFLGAAFGLGVLVARFLKSTPPEFDNSPRAFDDDSPRALNVANSENAGRKLNAPRSQPNQATPKFGADTL